MVRSRYIVGLILLIFFVMSFLTNIPGAIIPDIITGFSVSLTVVALLPFFFFSAYGVMSIPAGLSGGTLHRKAGYDCFVCVPGLPVHCASRYIHPSSSSSLLPS